jgi:hypothetical protein
MKKITLQPMITLTPAQLAGPTTINGIDKLFGLEDVKEVIITLNMVLADRTNADETYAFFVNTFHRLPSGVYARWDICAFTSIATVTARYLTMVVKGQPPQVQTVTTAGPGVVAVNTSTLATITDAAAEGRGTLTAGMVRNGALGEGLNYTLIPAGTTPGPITFELAALVKA